jgi:hypothetical protein
LINSEERGEEMQQDDNDDSTSINADNDGIDNDQKLQNSSSSYEDNNEEWRMKRAKKAFAASAEDEDDWLFRRARFSFAASAEEVNDENKKYSSDPMEITTKAYIDEVLAEMKKLDRGKGKMKTRYKAAATTAEAAENRGNKKMQQKE